MLKCLKTFMIACIACIVIGADEKYEKEPNTSLPPFPSWNVDIPECIKVLQAQQNLHTFWSSVTNTANRYAFGK